MVKGFLREVIPIYLQQYNLPLEEFIGSFVYGSWNYGLNTSSSDMDLIIITKNFTYDDDIKLIGEIHFITVDFFIECLFKRQPKYFEILYTQYCYINPSYEDAWITLRRELSEEINSMDFLYTLKNKISEHFDFLLWVPIQSEAKERYHQKRMYMLLRVREQYENIKNGMSFADSLLHQNKMYSNLVEIKTIPNYFTHDEVYEILKSFRCFLLEEKPPRKQESIKEKEIISSFLKSINKTPQA